MMKYAIEPAHEALFNARSYGFRPGRSTHDCQKLLFQNLNSGVNGMEKQILEIDIEKCFDRINHNFLMSKVIAPQNAKRGLWKCLKIGVNPEFPDSGTPQGGVCSPLLANIALDGIEEIHKSVRYADDMVFLLKPNENAQKILDKLQEFLHKRGLNIKASKTQGKRISNAIDTRIQKDDDIRTNRQQELCKNHHWGFDKGWFAISDDYTLLIW
jgi:RNA-directed DNA polymerase